MKKLILIAALGFGSTASFAQQKNQGGNGPVLLNLGVGLSNWGIPVYGGIEGYIHPDFTIGGVLSYRGYRPRYSGYDYRYSITNISMVGNYHFNRILNIPREWDLYAGLSLGYSIVTIRRPNGAPDYNRGIDGIGLGLQVGGRYYFNNKVGLNLELGGTTALSGARFGVTFAL